MTEEQRKIALSLCDRILQTAARLQADLRATSTVIEEEIEFASRTTPSREETHQMNSTPIFLGFRQIT